MASPDKGKNDNQGTKDSNTVGHKAPRQSRRHYGGDYEHTLLIVSHENGPFHMAFGEWPDDFLRSGCYVDPVMRTQKLSKDEAQRLIERMESFSTMNWHGYPAPLLISDREREALGIATLAAMDRAAGQELVAGQFKELVFAALRGL